MPRYQCSSCANVMELHAVTLKKRITCEGCGEHIDAKDLVPDTTPLGQPSASKRSRPAVVGRSASAPAATTWPFVGMNSQVQYVGDIAAHVGWQAASSTRFRLVYELLDIGVLPASTKQGLIIALPELAGDAVAQAHFQKITQVMEAPVTATDCTEATGEAAAAMCILREHRNFRMVWGFHCHKGAGIDQIWIDMSNGTLSDVLIVEAKGPGAVLSGNTFMPPGFDQMSERWIMHNLATMMNGGSDDAKALASQIVRALGLQVGVTFPGYGGGSKSYYGVTSASGTATLPSLKRVLVTADWQADGMLTYTKTVMPALAAISPVPSVNWDPAGRGLPARPIAFS